jgi:hypothetical protein
VNDIPVGISHSPFPDDGVLYCGWAGDGRIVGGCGEVWPCSTVRAAQEPVDPRVHAVAVRIEQWAAAQNTTVEEFARYLLLVGVRLDPMRAGQPKP